MAGEKVARAFEDTGGDFLKVETAGLDREMGAFRIPRHALGQQGLDFLARVFGVQQWPLAVAAGALKDGAYRCL
ncbi:hypothetical protein D3C83_149120 [compost metagenome]